MEEETTIAEEAAYEMDKGIAAVMPPSWEGHARISIKESENIPAKIEDKAIAKVRNLSEEKNASPQTVAKKLISHFAEEMS